MSADRARSNELPLTQEFLSYMLGVRRAGITQAAGGFQKRGLIRYTRGMLTLTNRAGMEAAACSCYAQDRAGYAAVMG
jgi:CRP-like cAMP-binding protein